MAEQKVIDGFGINPMTGGGTYKMILMICNSGASSKRSRQPTKVLVHKLAYGTDFDGTPFEDGKYRNFMGTGPISIDEDDYGAKFFDFLSGAPNITNGYGLFDYFSADAREARKAEAEADKAAETEAAAAAAAQAQAAEAQAQAADKAAADKAVSDAIAQGGTTGFNIADVKRESFRGRMDGGGGFGSNPGGTGSDGGESQSQGQYAGSGSRLGR